MARGWFQVRWLALAAALAALAAVAAGCGGEQRPAGSVSVSGTGSGTGTGTGTGTATGTGTGTATGTAVAPGTVEPPPAGAAQVRVELREWAVLPSPAGVKAGTVYILAENTGREPHELVVIRTDRDPKDLPVQDGRVPEDRVEVVGEIEAFAAGSRASGVFRLEPGTYAFICNIVEEEGGQRESHYQEGMYARFTVTE